MAISCKLNNDILKTTSCGYALFEINDLYVANMEDITTVSVGDGECGEEVTGVTMAGSAKWYHIEPQKGSVDFTDELVVEDNGQKYRTQTITFGVGGAYDDCAKANLDALSLGRFVVVALLADGSSVMLGRTTGLEASAASFGGGGDTNGMTVTLTANVTESAMPVTEDALAKIKNAGV